MFSRIHNFFRNLRKKISRSEWAVKILGLPASPDTAQEPGMVIIQIDGLSMTQLKKAFNHQRLPFLRQLVDKRHFQLKSFYSGIPSTTPAVQGELFFGVKSSVPGFEFVHRKSNRRYVMYSSEAADFMAETLEQKGKPLLKGGSSYSNIYIAGAGEARYCIQNMKLESILKAANPLNLGLLIVFHLWKFVRIAALSAIEVGLAVVDFFRGITGKKHLIKELKFIPTRIGVNAVLRELTRFRVKMDVSRGVPVIHANFLGYDEQSHRRGPSSRFAHWTLKGIDGAIKDIFQAARRSDFRRYRFAFYSDHGQEDVQSYTKLFGKTVEEAILSVFSELYTPPSGFDSKTVRKSPNMLYRRGINMLFGKRTNEPFDSVQDEIRQIRITATGPIGHIYLPFEVSENRKPDIARRLNEKADIPLVLYISNGEVFGINPNGRFKLLEQKEKILGNGHPFMDDAAEDLKNLCFHEDAGDFIISGWIPSGKPITFPIENGAHGGPGSEETHGFIIFSDIYNTDKDFLRPLDLREYVNLVLRGRIYSITPPKPSTKNRNRLRVMTYNIHSCINMDGKVFPERIGEAIASLEPDIVALQEVDEEHPRTHYCRQAEFIADYLGMAFDFFPVLKNGAGKYGLAILSRYPIQKIQHGYLPYPFKKERHKLQEKRGAMLVGIETFLGRLVVLNTHLGLYPMERRIQIEELTGDKWLSDETTDTPLIFCGDLNTGERSFSYKRICERLSDVQRLEKAPGYPKPTFFSWRPIFRLDHIFVSRHFNVNHVVVPDTYRFRIASDHLPVFAEISLL